MGLIDVSSLQSPENRESQHLALQLVMKAARMIESAYFLDHFKDQWIIGLNHEREFADVTSECYLAVSGEGKSWPPIGLHRKPWPVIDTLLWSVKTSGKSLIWILTNC